MKINILKVTVAAVSAAVLSYFGMLAVPVLVLLIAMVIDYVTGMIKAYMQAQLCSKTGVKGILKKLCYMAMVAVGAVVDYLLQSAFVQAGIDLHIDMFCGLLVAIWLIINELISILENLAVIGVPGFPKLSKLLQRLKTVVENHGSTDDTSAEE